MILRLLKSTEWGQLLDFVSPSFFDVMPAGALAGQARALLASRRDRDGFVREARALSRLLGRRGVPLRVSTERAEGDGLPQDGDARRERGGLVLRLYFEQLLHRDAALLDLRASAFRRDRGRLVFAPSPGSARWDPEFLGALRRVYRGFYRGEESCFEEGLAALRLEPARELFLRHFGEGDQTGVRFRMAHFTKSFHDVFVRCREHGLRLQGDFVPLGVHLAALYEHLEALGEPLDVRAAFHAADASGEEGTR